MSEIIKSGRGITYRSAVEHEIFTYDERRVPMAKASYRDHEGVYGVVIKPKAEGSNGQWVCCTCGVPLDNQLDKDCHVNVQRQSKKTNLVRIIGPEATHVLAWRNFETGDTEVP